MSTPLNNSLLKGFEILRLITRERPEVSASVVQSELGMNAATAHRFLATLEEAGALFPVRRGVYQLSPATAAMGRLAEENNPYVHHLQTTLNDLRERLNESVMACRLGSMGPTCVSVAPADRPITVSIRVGTTLSLLNSAQGKIWLAHMTPAQRDSHLRNQPAGSAEALESMNRELNEIRARGLALNLGGAEADIGAVAAPVLNQKGGVMLTISVFGPLSRFGAEFQTTAGAAVREAASDVETSLRRVVG